MSGAPIVAGPSRGAHFNQVESPGAGSAAGALYRFVSGRIHKLLFCVHKSRKLWKRLPEMPANPRRTHKHFRFDGAKIERAQRVLRADTETEAIERDLDLLLSEHKQNRVTSRANEQFLASGAISKDVYGNHEP
jgi:hypothetical protein